MALDDLNRFVAIPACGAALAVWLLAVSSSPAAERKEKDEKPQPPRLTLALPLGLHAGQTNQLRLRGLHLTTVTELRWADPAPPFTLAWKNPAKADVPGGADATKAGDSQVEVEIFVPAQTPAALPQLVALNPVGASQPLALRVLGPGPMVEEREPNPGFRKAQRIESGVTIRGAIQPANDVDVFAFTARAGQRLRLEIQAARLGSLHDPLLTVYDGAARVLAVNDDLPGTTDAGLTVAFPAAGDYFICLQDAHDRGSPLHPYLLYVADD